MSEPKLLLAPVTPNVVARRIFQDGSFIVDAWQVLPDDVAIESQRHIIVPLARWRSERARLQVLPDVGIIVQPGETLDAGGDALQRLGLIVLMFPKFSDGRAYSMARRLREQFDVRCDIRAAGDVLLDQMPLMQRAGFTSFEIVNAATIRALEQGQMPSVRHVYQTATESGAASWLSRRATPSLSAALDRPTPQVSDRR